MEAVPDAQHTQTQGGIDAFDRLAIMVFARQSWMIGFFKAMQGRYILEVFKIPRIHSNTQLALHWTPVFCLVLEVPIEVQSIRPHPTPLGHSFMQLRLRKDSSVSLRRDSVYITHFHRHLCCQQGLTTTLRCEKTHDQIILDAG